MHFVESWKEKMAVHFTENKSNASVSAIKTPFLIEDILDRNSIKAGHKISFKNHPDHIINQNTRNSGGEPSVNSQNEKHMRNNNEISPSDDDYRKLLQSERYAKFMFHQFFSEFSETRKIMNEPSAGSKFLLKFKCFIQMIHWKVWSKILFLLL